MHNLLEIDSITKTFNMNPILTDIYLKCQTGDIIGLLGRNGTGKSTLLKILFGSTEADTKFITINGKIYNHPYKTANLISYLPQHSFLLNQLTVSKSIALFLGRSNANGFANDPLIAPFLDHKISALSGGNLRYLEIKLILNTDSKFLLLDEPFNGMSPLLVETVKQMIKAQSAFKGIILTDHDYNNVIELATRSYLVYEGSLKNIGTTTDLVRWGYLSC